VPEKTMGFF